MIESGKYCHECDYEKRSPWFDEESGLWVHTQESDYGEKGMIVICNRRNPDPDDNEEEMKNG